MLREVKQKLEEEMQRIEYELRVTLPKEIQAALGQGDLSENAEYHAAREKQSFTEARINDLESKLGEVTVGARLRDCPYDRRSLDALQPVELVLETGMPFAGHGRALDGHAATGRPGPSRPGS